MTDTEIVEILEDGTIYHFDIDVCDDAAEEAIEKLWDKENKELKFDFSAAIFSLFVKAVGILTRSGWTTEDLIREIYNHSEADDNVCECCGKRFNDHDVEHDHDDEDD